MQTVGPRSPGSAMSATHNDGQVVAAGAMRIFSPYRAHRDEPIWEGWSVLPAAPLDWRMEMRRATLVIAGNIAQALGAVIAHQITSAKAMVEDPHGLKIEGSRGCITRVTVDADHYGDMIAAWLNERGRYTFEPGFLLRVRWADLPEDLARDASCGIIRDSASRASTP